MNSFERFQKLNQNRVVANNSFNKVFLKNGYPSTVITDTAGNTKTAVVVNRQEKDLAYVYTSEEDALSIGSVWGTKSLKWLISEEIITIKDVKFHKYLAFLCNVQVSSAYGYFVGPEKTAINTVIKQQSVLVSQQKPLLILGGTPLSIGNKVLISGRSFDVEEMDNISTAGITYYTLKLGTMSKDKSGSSTTGVIETPTIETPDIVVTPTYNTQTGHYEISAEIPITLATENGYFLSSEKQVVSTSLSATSVTFTIPFGISLVTIAVKNDGTVVSRTYEVV